MLNYANKAFHKILLYPNGLAPIVSTSNKKYFPTIVGLAYNTLPFMFYNHKFIRFLKRIKSEEGFDSITDEELLSFIDPKYNFGPLMNLYNLCFYYGKLDILCKIRETAIISLCNKNIPTSKLLQKDLIKIKALALAETGKAKELFRLIESFNLIDEDIQLYYNLYFQIPKIYRERLELVDLDLDPNFNELVNGKRVAIVGPAASNEHNGDEIDNFDVVVRLNYKGHNDFGSPSLNGKRIDISYYNFSTAKNLKTTTFMGSLSSYVVPLGSVNHDILSSKIRERIYSPILLNGIPNMIQHIVFDLLLYSPAKIKVFNCNFYAGKSTYDSSYVYQGKSGLTIKNLALHDQWSQVCFIRNLYLNNLIEVDKSCNSILRMSCEEYFSVLSSKFTSV